MKNLTFIFLCLACVVVADDSFEAYKWRYGVRFSSPEEEHLRYVLMLLSALVAVFFSFRLVGEMSMNEKSGKNAHDHRRIK